MTLSERFLTQLYSDCTLAYIRTFVLPVKYGGKVATFTPTGSIGNRLFERYPSLRAPLHERLRHIVMDCGAWMHALLVAAIGCGVALCVRQAAAVHLGINGADGQRDWYAFWVELLRTAAWPGHPWLSALAACLTPIQYAVSPPTVHERDRLMGKRAKSGVRYPLPEFKEKISRSRFELRFVQLHTLWTAYVVVVFISTFYMD